MAVLKLSWLVLLGVVILISERGMFSMRSMIFNRRHQAEKDTPRIMQTLLPSTDVLPQSYLNSIAAASSSRAERRLIEVSSVGLMRGIISSQTQFSSKHQEEQREQFDGGVVTYLTYTTLSTTTRFDRFIFPSLDTWHPTSQPYYVVLSSQWKNKLSQLMETNQTWQAYSSRMKILFVDCLENDGDTYNETTVRSYFQSACCKQEKSIVAMMMSNDDDDDSSWHTDWLLVADDDNYFRHEDISKALRDRLPHDQAFAVVNGEAPSLLGQSGYGRNSPYQCSKEESHQYRWDQVTVYNRHTLEVIRPGLEAGGLQAQCNEFGVAQDVGGAIFHWMYSLPSVRIDIQKYCYRVAEKRLDRTLGCHGPSKVKADQFATEMTDMHKLYSELPSAAASRQFFLWWNVTGFKSTKTFQQYGDPRNWSQWHTFPVQDCLSPSST